MEDAHDLLGAPLEYQYIAYNLKAELDHLHIAPLNVLWLISLFLRIRTQNFPKRGPYGRLVAPSAARAEVRGGGRVEEGGGGRL